MNTPTSPESTPPREVAPNSDEVESTDLPEIRTTGPHQKPDATAPVLKTTGPHEHQGN